MSNKEEKKERTLVLNESTADLVLGAFFLVFSLILLFVIIPTQIEDVGAAFPSPRFFSRMCGVILLVLSLCELYQGFRKRGKAHKDSEAVTFSLKGVSNAVIALAVLIAVVVLLKFLPYVPVTIVMLVVLMLLLGQRHKLVLAGVGIILPIAVYLFFTYGLKLVLP